VPELSNDRVERYFDKHAPRFDREMLFFERHVLGHHRRWATAQASGRVLELAVGTGLNLPLYAAAVDHVLGIELSERMVERARDRIAAHDLHDIVDVRVGDVQALDLPEESFDTVLSTYTMCTIPAPDQALREAVRVLKPGGRVVLVEHGSAANRVVRAGQRLVNPLSMRLGADHLLREPAPLAAAAGLSVTHADRAGWAGIVHRVVGTKR
jgi:ubiquinone/menaquinone biosynthesis C-methylase UbiE